MLQLQDIVEEPNREKKPSNALNVFNVHDALGVDLRACENFKFIHHRDFRWRLPD